MAEEGPAPSRAWPHLRAALLALHLFAVVLMALPAPVGADKRSAYANPQTQRELANAAAGLARLGIHRTPRELEDLAVRGSARIVDARKAILKPLKPYWTLFGTRQDYRMFSGTSPWSDRMRVEVQEGGVWRTVYRTRDSQATWRRSAFDHELGRSMLYRYSERRHRKRWREFTAWQARKLAEDFPAAQRARVSWSEVKAPSPADSRAGVGVEEAPPREIREFDLEAMR